MFIAPTLRTVGRMIDVEHFSASSVPVACYAAGPTSVAKPCKIARAAFSQPVVTSSPWCILICTGPGLSNCLPKLPSRCGHLPSLKPAAVMHCFSTSCCFVIAGLPWAAQSTRRESAALRAGYNHNPAANPGAAGRQVCAAGNRCGALRPIGPGYGGCRPCVLLLPGLLACFLLRAAC